MKSSKIAATKNKPPKKAIRKIKSLPKRKTGKKDQDTKYKVINTIKEAIASAIRDIIDDVVKKLIKNLEKTVKDSKKKIPPRKALTN